MSSEQNFKKSKVAKVAKKGLFRIVFSRTGIMLLLILIQLGIFIMIPYYLNAYTTYIYGAFRAVSLLVLIHIINSKGNPAFKMTWTLCVLVFPVVGSILSVCPVSDRNKIFESKTCGTQDRDRPVYAAGSGNRRGNLGEQISQCTFVLFSVTSGRISDIP